MNRTFNITLKAAAAILAVILAASCVFEKENPVSKQQKQNVLVQIGVSTDGMAQTKADVITGTDQAGEGVDTTISTLRLYAYIGNVLSGYAYVPEYSATDKIYMDLKNLPSSGTQQVEFVAVANEGSMTGINGINIEVGTNSDGTISLPSNFGRNSFEGIIYTIANQGFTAKVDEKEKVVGMPMYATKTVTIDVDKVVGDPNTADGHNGHFILQESVNLTLTRSLAKIEVYAAESASATTGKNGTATTSVTITGVSLANVPQSGNLFTAPAAGASITYTTFKDAEGKETAYSGSFLKAGTVSKKVNQGDANAIKDPANYTLVSNAYYLAENNKGDEAKYDYGATDYTTGDAATKATVLKIDYSLDGGKTSKSGYVKMPQIKRNTWYKVLARIQANGELTLTLKVQKWSSGQIQNVNFRDEVTLSKASWSFDEGVKNGQNGNIIFGTAKDLSATYRFTLDTPVGGKWYASLDGDIQNFVLETGEGDSKQSGKTVSGNITAQSTSVTVKTIVSNAEQGQKTATFKLIARTADETRTLTVKFDTDGTEYYTLIQNQ